MASPRSGTAMVLDALLEQRSGVAFIYWCLERVARSRGLEDAVLVLEDEVAGRQAFRLGRAPTDDGWPAEVAFDAPAGLHTRPAGRLPVPHADGLAALAKVAWTLETLRHDARVDPLTGLLNRYGFEEHLELALDRHRRYREPFTLMVADLDRFKAVNDRLGHPAGDRLLEVMADVLAGVIRGVDVAARIGGDEFAILLSDAGGDVADRIHVRLAGDLPDRYGGIPVSVSVGVATCPDDGTTAGALHETADRRLYAAKRRGA